MNKPLTSERSLKTYSTSRNFVVSSTGQPFLPHLRLVYGTGIYLAFRTFKQLFLDLLYLVLVVTFSL